MSTTATPVDSLHERIVALGPRLAPVEQSIAGFLLDNPQVAAEASAAEIGRAVGASDASVIRAVKALGYSGLRELRRERVRALAAQGDPQPMLERRLSKIDSASGEELVRVIDDTVRVLHELSSMQSQTTWDKLVGSARKATRIVLFGVGTARAVADYVSLQLARSGISSHAMTKTGFQLADDLIGLRPGDLVIVIAPLRRYEEIDAVLSRTREVGCTSVVISETLGMTYRGAATFTIPTPRTTVGTSSEIVSALIIGHALVLALASLDHDTALSATRVIDSFGRRLAAAGESQPT